MNPPEKVFTHSIKEGVFAGLAVALLLEAVLFGLILMLSMFRAAGDQKLPEVGNTMVSVSIIVLLMFLAMVAGYRHAARYSVAVDREFIVLRKQGVEYDRRRTPGFLRLQTSMGQPRHRLEFVDQPALPITWLAGWKVSALEKHLTALQGEPPALQT